MLNFGEMQEKKSSSVKRFLGFLTSAKESSVSGNSGNFVFLTEKQRITRSPAGW